MVSHFREDLEVYLTTKYKHGNSVEDPYELVKVNQSQSNLFLQTNIQNFGQIKVA